MSNVVVRHATAADLPRIGRLGALLIEEHHHFDSRRFLAAKQRTPMDYASFLSTQLEDPDAVVLVVDDNGDVIGYAYAAVEGYDYRALRGPAGVLHDVIHALAATVAEGQPETKEAGWRSSAAVPSRRAKAPPSTSREWSGSTRCSRPRIRRGSWG
jgi:hypothetical protein